MSKRYFQVEIIHDYGTDNERRETVYETAVTARDVLRARGVHLGKDEKARGKHKYASEFEGALCDNIR